MKKQSLNELGRISEREFKQASKFPIHLVLDNIRSAYNVGAFFRTADAFRVEKLHLCGITAQPPHKEILKTAIGAENTVSWKYYDDARDCVKELKESGCEIVGVEQTDESIELQTIRTSIEKKYALIFGNEVDGISDPLLPMLDKAVEIPQYGTKHSFNVGVCGGIVLWQYMGGFLAAMKAEEGSGI